MRNYKNGKIYVIRNYVNELVYVGSTTAPLYKRFSKHKSDINTQQKSHRKLYIAMREIGVEHFYIELIEMYPCDNIAQLEAREGHWQRELDSYKNGYNGKIQGRTKQEWEQDNKEKIRRQHSKRYKKYYEANRNKCIEKSQKYHEKNKEKVKDRRKEYNEKNKEMISEKRKEYREKNKEKISKKSTEYREKNKEKISMRMKEYREKNKDKIQEYREKLYEKVECACGSEVSRQHLKRHYTSKKHQEYMNRHK